MINKKNLWFLTLFSLILVLSIYYITMPSELLLTNNKEEKETKENTKTTVEVEESELLSALRVEANAETEKEIEELTVVLTDSDSSTDEKNKAYDKIKQLNGNKGEQETLETKIKEELNLNTFVKIDGDKINVTVDQKKHDTKLANSIMRCVQSNYKTNKYVSVTFQK